MVSVPARRQQVAYGRERGLSARRACTLFSVARSALQLSQPQGGEGCAGGRADDRSCRRSIRATAIGASASFSAATVMRMSPGRAHRLWRAARLQVPRKRPSKRVAAGTAAPASADAAPNQVWSYDFVFDHCANGQQLKCLTVTDEFTKEGLAIDVDGRIRSARVIEVLSRLVSARGAPTFLRSDNGPEFVSKALLSWIVAQGIGTALIEPGKPWQNGVAESFNGKFRDECLSLEWFRSRAEAKVLIEEWRRHLQRGASAFEPRLSHAERVRGSRSKTSAPSCNGPGRCGIWGLRAPARCSTVPAGTNAASKGSRLKLTVVRRNRAGQGVTTFDASATVPLLKKRAPGHPRALPLRA